MMKRTLQSWLRMIVAAIFLAVGVISPALAGWIVEQSDRDFPDEKTTFFVRGDKVRVEGLLPGLSFLIDLSSDQAFIVDEAVGKYAGGNVDDIEAALKEYAARILSGSEEDENALESGNAGATPPQVEVEEMGKGEKVAGYPTNHYRIKLDGDLVEELWLSTGVAALPPAGAARLVDILEVMTGGGAGGRSGFSPGYETHPAYRALFESGYPMKRKTYIVGQETIVETGRVEEDIFSETSFDIPDDFEKVDYVKLFFGAE